MKKIAILGLVFFIFGSSIFSQEKKEKAPSEEVVVEIVTNLLDIYDLDLEMLIEYQSVRENTPAEKGSKKEYVFQVVVDLMKLYDMDLEVLLNTNKIEINK